MPFALDTPRLAANTIASPMGVESVAKAQSGVFRGQSVTRANPAQINDTARAYVDGPDADTMSLQRLLVLSKRAGGAKHAGATSRIAEFYDKLPNMPGRPALRRLIAALRRYQDVMKKDKARGATARSNDDDEEEGGTETSEGRRAARQVISGSLDQFDQDESHQFATLEILIEELGDNDGDPDFQAALHDVSQYFQQTDIARNVRAGMAAAKAANDAAATLGTDPAAIRNAYRAMIRQEMDFAKLFDALAKFDPLKNCDAIIDTFCTAAGTDLSNLTGPSTDRTLLQALLTELGKLKKLRTVLDGCGKLVEDVDAALDRPQKGMLKATDVASRVLNFINKSSASFKDALALMGRLADARAIAKLMFFNGLEALLVLIPDDLFPNMQARLAQKQLLRKVNDKLVDEEEEEFAREESIKKRVKRQSGEKK